MINKNEYLAYLHSLRGFIFKILPLYEVGYDSIQNYIESLIFEIHNVREITPQYDAAWIVRNHAILNGLVDECIKKDNKIIIKNKVFSMLKIISDKIDNLEGEKIC